MGGLLLVLCVASLGAAVGIVYLLFGPTAAKPLVAVPRASMTIIPAPRVAQVHAAYDPEAVFASERAAALITPGPIAPQVYAAARHTPVPLPPAPVPLPPAPVPLPPVEVVQVVSDPAPRARALPPPMPAFMRGHVTAPQPLVRARAARGTDSPRAMPAPMVVADAAFADSAEFVDADPTVLGDESIAS